MAEAVIIESATIAGEHKPDKPDYSALAAPAAYVMSTYDEWAVERRAIEEKWLYCEKAYRSVYDPNPEDDKWKSRRFVPVSHVAVENIHAQLMNGLFPNVDSFFTVQPADEEYEERADVVREVLRNHLSRSAFREGFSIFLKQLIVLGTSAAMVDWDAATQTSRFIPLDMFYFHVDPYAGDPRFANKMRRYWMTEAEALASGAFDPDAVHRAAQGAQQKGAITTTSDSLAASRARFFGRTQGIDPHRGELEMTELWGTFEVEGVTYENHVITVANGEIVRFEPSPYGELRDPFVFTRYTSVPGEVYGIGALEPALPLQDLINVFTNQKVDELSLIINGVYKYVDDGVFDEQPVAEPGALIKVGDINNLQPLVHPSTVSLAYTEIADLERKFQEATGAIKLVVGGAESGLGSRATATEVMALTQSGSSRFNELLARVEANGLGPALHRYLRNAAMFMERPMAVRIFGDDEDDLGEWVAVSREDMDGDYTIELGGSKLVGVRDMRLQNIMRYLQTIGSIPQIAQRLDWEALNKRIWQELGFDTDAVPLLPEQPEQAQPLAANNQPSPPSPEPSPQEQAQMQLELLNGQG